MAFDANGRYASAIWLKQGSLAIGLLTLALAIASRLSMQVALAISLLVRLFWLGIFFSALSQVVNISKQGDEKVKPL